jgi:uncharacterized membrane protein YhaH (DUF805 family)
MPPDESSVPGIIHKQEILTPQPTVPQTPQRPPSPYFIRIFEGRLNRQNYGAGSLLLLGVPFICFLLFFGSILSTPGALSLVLINPYDIEQMQQPIMKVDSIDKIIVALQSSPLNITAGIILTIYMLITLPINIAFQVRRLHDMNNSGWLLLLNVIPFVSYLFPFYVTFFPGTEGENKFGPKPISRINIKEDILKLSPKPQSYKNKLQ